MGELLKTLKEQNSSELITKWENIGFLSNAKNKRNLALACEFSALYLLDNIETYNGEITTLTHPVIIRIFNKVEQDLPVELIFNKVIQIIIALSAKLITYQTIKVWTNRNPNLDEKDIELEFVKDFCDNYPFKFEPVRG
jgi:hypothetical protein